MRAFSLIALVFAVAIPVAGCGGDDDSSSSSSGSSSGGTNSSTTSTSGGATSGGGAAGSVLKIAADPSGALKFDKTSLSAKAGKVEIVMTNPSSTPHNVGVDGNGVDEDGPTVESGKTSTVTADLKAGTYEFYCPVDGHKAAGMKGELTVS